MPRSSRKRFRLSLCTSTSCPRHSPGTTTRSRRPKATRADSTMKSSWRSSLDGTRTTSSVAPRWSTSPATASRMT
ncbi:UNVERIFIED_CONTAM: hypothetical protein GTU68_006324 [Idotea baltica]|nr:hypothetical protein [Idotea baltica]